jgi:antitoxin component of MazEF toxin-antitoxin module
MQAHYALKVQAIRSKKQKPRLYVYLPAALAEAIGLEAGEDVRWELLSRGELHLVRERVPPTHAKHLATR